ncbi:MAG: sodium:proton antiporter [Myxococcales bacterium]|nr:sodium:proton antiporter [Myxococcales bacterium]
MDVTRSTETKIGTKKLSFQLEGANLCRQAEAGDKNPLTSQSVALWNETVKGYTATEPIGCNYDLQVLPIIVDNEKGHFRLHLGEKGVAPMWSVAAREAEPKPDWRSLLHPLLAIVIAILFSRVVLGLGLAILLGALVGSDGAPLAAFSLLFTQVKATLYSQWNGWILVFTCGLIAMVSLMRINGGMAGLVRLLSARVHNRRDAESATATLGFGLFFDDYANTVVVGSTMGAVTDRFGSSRAKLAYIVDSTSAPLAGLAFLSTWIGYEVGLLGTQCQALGLDLNGYALFLEGLGFRLYCLLALALVWISIRSRREMGPMLQAQRQAMMTRAPIDDPSDEAKDETGPSPKASRAIIPLAVTFASILGFFIYRAQLGGISPDLLSLVGLREILMADDQALGSLSLDIASILGLSSLIGLLVCLALGRLSPGETSLGAGTQIRAMGRGLHEVLPAIQILVLAWILGGMTGTVGTGTYLEALIGESINPGLLPAITFLLAAAIAFATGTSFGTMGILIPIILPLAMGIGDVGILIICSAAILDGAIFGDHCSPLSDTTILSSLASKCSLDEHVRTQLPYALLAMVIALLIGYIPAGLGWYGPWAAIPAGLLVLGGSYWLISQPIEDADSETLEAPGPAASHPP